MLFQRGVPLNRAASTQKESKIKDLEEDSKIDTDIVPHVSEDFLQCIDPSETPKRKRRRNVDEHIEEVTKSCLDLAIDG